MISLIKRTLNVCIWVLPAAAIFNTYHVIEKADVIEKELKIVKDKVAKKETDISVYRQEWAVLSRPERLMELREKYLPHFSVAGADKTFTEKEYAEMNRVKTFEPGFQLNADRPFIASFQPLD